jgi:hypothetical protein
VIFADESWEEFASLQSSIHAAFAWQHASRLKNDLRYSPTDAFETFPRPLANDLLSDLGERLHQGRVAVMRADRIGLTKFYHRFHADSEKDLRIEDLRILQREMDVAVAQAYGWTDLDLGHGFHEVPYLPENERVRFTISESARVEVLRRLSDLNRQRYEQEIGAAPSKATKKQKSRKRRTDQSAGDLFNTNTAEMEIVDD